MLHFHELTEEQKKKICNGCGAKGGWFDPPEFLFHASCNQHDFYYWRGGSEADRKKADEAFYRYMQIDANRYSGLKRLKYLAIAYIYYKAVRIFGRRHFYYGKQKTREDLQ